MATPQLSLKLLIDTKSKKVLFAEAVKDVVDFLFSLLSLPVGSIINLLTEQKMVGCIGSLYRSVESLDETYFQSNQNKSSLLNPSTASSSKNTLFLTGARSTTSAAKKFYKCSYAGYEVCKSNYTDVFGTRCPGNCGYQMTVEMRYVGPNSGTVAAAGAATGESGGFVKSVVTYSVMDDLTVTPTSTISSIAMLNKFNVKDLSSLEERTVHLGMEEGLELLKGSLQSKTVLTDVFLGKKTATVVG